MALNITSGAARALSILALALVFGAGSAAEAGTTGKRIVETITSEALYTGNDFGAGSPAEGLRDAARRSLGLEPAARRVAPSTLTADALYARIRISL